MNTCFPGALQRTNTENLKQISQKRNIAASVPNILIHVSVSYLFIPTDRSACLFCCRKYVDRSWEYINHSQTSECGNWDWGRVIPGKGTQKWDFCCSVYWRMDPESRETVSLMQAGEAGEGGRHAHQATHERLHDLGEGREEEDSQELSWYAQLKHLQNIRLVTRRKKKTEDMSSLFIWT